MVTQVSYIAIGAAVALQLGHVGLAQAQVTERAADSSFQAEDESAEFGEIIVTARKRSETLSQSPVAATVLTGDVLAKQAISNLQQIGTLVPNVQITSTIFIDSIFVRGVGSSPNDPGFEQQTGLFVDGVYYGNGRWISSGNLDAASVQILPGPQGVYFGKNTIAGAIDINTNNPGGELEGYVKAGYEFNAREVYGEAVISGPLSETFGARLAVRASDMKGWMTNIGDGKRDPGGTDKVARLTLAWTPSPDFDANLKIQVQDYEDNGPTARTILLNCAGPNNTPAPLTLAGTPFFGPTSGAATCRQTFKSANPHNLRDGRAFSDVPAYALTYNMHWRMGKGVLTSTTGLNRYKFKSYAGLNTSTFNGVEGANAARNEAFSTELRYETGFDGPVNLMFGGYYQTTDFTNYFAASLFPTAFQGALFTFEQGSATKSKTKSAFAEALWDITDSLELDLGVRYTRETKRSRVTTLSVAPFPAFPPLAGFFPAVDLAAKQDFSNWSPQGTLTWRPSDDFMAYVSYKTGFLSGGFAHAQIPGPTTTIDDFLYGPEKTKGFEVGTKFSLANRRLQINVAAYHFRYKGLQVSTFNPASISFSVENAGRSVAKGVELMGRWHPTKGLTVNGNLAYGESYYTRYIGQCLPTATFAMGCNVSLPGGGFAQNFKGFSTSFAPKWSGRFGLEHETDLGPDTTLNLGAGISFSDDYVVGDVLRQEGWTKLDGRMSLTHGPWQVALIGNNLTNKAICAQGSSRPLGGLGEVNCWLDRGREVRLETSFKF